MLFLETPKEGGALEFTDLDLSIPAVRRTAVLWPTVMVDDPSLPELLTHHASIPVRKGRKLALVTWIHAYDWRTLVVERGCRHEVERTTASLQPPLMWLPSYMKAREGAGLPRRVPQTLLDKATQARQQQQEKAAAAAAAARSSSSSREP